MPVPFNSYWDKILVINRDVRADRWAYVIEQQTRYSLPEFVRFRAHEGRMLDGSFNGNWGCTSSHRGVLELIAHHGWRRTLVLEDDFEIVEPGRWDFDRAKDRLPFQAQWLKMIDDVPTDWDMLYLGAHHGDPLQARVSRHVVRIGRTWTTSSYGITNSFARRMAPHIANSGPIDSLYGEWNVRGKCYCFQPRLMVQREGHSDLQHLHHKNAVCMLDPSHEDAI